MKILKLFSIFLISISLNAKSFLLSPLPLPSVQVLDITLKECDEICLKELLQKGKVFTFLAKAKSLKDSEELKENFLLLCNLLNISQTPLNIQKLKIAQILPIKKIGKYAISSTKSIISYLLLKNVRFYLQNFEIADEDIETLSETIEKIKEEGFDFVIAPLTIDGANNLAQIEPEIKIYIPTINKKDLNNEANNNLFFGGIDYKEQIDLLLSYANDNIVIFYEPKSPLAKKLTKTIENSSNTSKLNEIAVTEDAYNLKKYFYKNEDLNSTTVFLNTPIVKSSLILSQLTLYDLKPQQILSTQINYNPLIFSLTQPKDRENLLIANIIEKKSKILQEYNLLINNDIYYNWINYSVSIGIDLFFSQKSYQKRVFSQKIDNSQVIYNNILYKATFGKFTPLEIFEENQQE